MTREGLDRLLQSVDAADSVLILPHSDPDPDAVASAVALRHLLAETRGIESRIAYRGIIGRAENKALVRFLGHPLERLTGLHLRSPGVVALVDTQPGAGINPLPAGFPLAVVLDHHPWRDGTADATYADVRPDIGSTSTIVCEYLEAADIKLPSPLATALFYGIKTDTLGLVRGASPADVAAYFHLQPLVDVEALVEIERAQVPIDYFQKLDATLHSAKVYDELITSYIGPMRRPDLAAEMADLLLRLRGMQSAVCIGLYKGELVISIRTRSGRPRAGYLAEAVVGGQGTAGGHGTMAGGQVPLRGADPERLAEELVQRVQRLLSVPGGTVGHALLRPGHL